MRIGHGYDLHRLTAGEGLVLAGEWIACDYAIVAHSDGDVILHAVCDAIFGALALGDIGQHFPDTAAENTKRDSREFLHYAVEKMMAMNYHIVNVDVTVIAQTPKLAPHHLRLRENLTQLLSVRLDQVSIKAKTNEGVDAIGMKQALAAHAVILLTEVSSE